MRYKKYHGLGNDYIVLHPEHIPAGVKLDATTIQQICHRHYGVGSDGILLGPLKDASGHFGLRIFNPDGSEAEKSGNGLRIFARSLWDDGLVTTAPFKVQTLGGMVQCQLNDDASQIRVEMGQVTFEALNKDILIDSQNLHYSAASIGNPHCVLIADDISKATTCHLGPLLENHPTFPNRTNVQFMKIIDRHHIQLEIWERGAGYTLASGSSSVAAAAIAHKLDLCDSAITVIMPGGSLHITFNTTYYATMTGPAVKVCEGRLFLPDCDNIPNALGFV